MNPAPEDVPPVPPEPIAPVPPAVPSGPVRDVRWWIRRLLVCNPFYLASAALLLFGVNRITLEPGLLTTEFRQVLFQFSALQAYGLLLVGTALGLAWRRIWYDSSLLVVLENGLVLVPFLFISQAVLLDEHLASDPRAGVRPADPAGVAGRV